MQNLISQIFLKGVICDGAKLGCSLKLTTAAESAIRAALLAMEGITIPAGEGIVDSSIDQTVKNLRRISEAMREVDKLQGFFIFKVHLSMRKLKRAFSWAYRRRRVDLERSPVIISKNWKISSDPIESKDRSPNSASNLWSRGGSF